VKYKGHHHKEVVRMKPTHLNHLPELVNTFEQERDHELRLKRPQKKKKDPPINGLSVDGHQLLKWAKMPTLLNTFIKRRLRVFL
jgi:hypothetical protein